VTTRVTTSVDVDIDLDDFDDDDLADELRDRGYIVSETANARPGESVYADIASATAELRANRRLDALIQLERALGPDWAGVLTQGMIR
jgi:hypothetical protein